MKSKSLLKLTRAAVVAALYVALTLTPPLSALSFGALQLRVSEALCVLPMLFPETGVGLILGCLIANLSSPLILPLDLMLGTGATVIAVFFTVRLGRSKKPNAILLLKFVFLHLKALSHKAFYRCLLPL